MKRTLLSCFKAITLLVLGLCWAGAEETTRYGVTIDRVNPYYVGVIARYVEADQKEMPASGGVLFYGSSTIRLWKPYMARHMEGLSWVNRGFGGAKTCETLYFFNDVVTPYKPALIVYFCGTNDTADSAISAQDTIANTEKFISLVHEQLPGTRILYMSITKVPSRKQFWEKCDAINAHMKALCERSQDMAYFEMNTITTDKKGKPIKNLYENDMLHLNERGYDKLAAAIRPVIEAELAKAKAAKK